MASKPGPSSKKKNRNTPLTIWAIIVGEKEPFKIATSTVEQVDDLIFKVKARQGIPAVERPLLQKLKSPLEITPIDSLGTRAMSLHDDDLISLSAHEYLSDVYPRGSLPLDHIHLLVRRRSVEEIPVYNNPTPLPMDMVEEPGKAKSARISLAKDVTGIRETITRLLQEGIKLPIWTPRNAHHFEEHITSLRIPVLSTTPSLLLHNLGVPSYDVDIEHRIRSIFSTEPRAKFLCNTSGSGKTRLILEGLVRNWGFYFTARNEPDNVGSEDLQKVLNGLHVALVKLSDAKDKKDVLFENVRIARHRFLSILYARILVFRIFLSCVAEQPGGLSPSHKESWLLLQVNPKFFGEPDVFYDLARKIASSVEWASMLSAVESEMETVKAQLEPNSHIFCVIDEAQVPAGLYTTNFLSEEGHPRPVIREIVRTWSDILPRLILSGTGLSIDVLETALGSVVAKEGPAPIRISDVGAFDFAQEQQCYLEQYLPPEFVKTESGRCLMTRAALWLRGRHRFTATFLSILLQSSFQSPHRILNKLVFELSCFLPSDDDYFSMCEPEPPNLPWKFRGFDFSKLEHDHALLHKVVSIVFEYILCGKVRSLGGPLSRALVECGFARFRNDDDTTVDEPIALLAAANFFTTRTTWSMRSLLESHLTSLNPASRGFSFEHFIAYLLARAFKSPRALSSVFDFIDETELTDEVAHLVAINLADDNQFICTPVDISSNGGPHYILGCSPSSESETLEWLKNPKNTVFCFPIRTVGPDVILTLQLSDGGIVRVLVQCKQRNQATLGAQRTQDAFRSTDNQQFISQWVEDPETKQTIRDLANPELTEELRDALRALGPSSDKAGEDGVLRVVVSHPAQLDIPTLQMMVKADKCRHPGATIDAMSLVGSREDLDILTELGDTIMRKKGTTKRKAEDPHDIAGQSNPGRTSPKRNKTHAQRKSSRNKRGTVT